MHQNKPVADITFLNHKGNKILVSDVPSKADEKSLSLDLNELAILQTCLNRSYFNCNCDLNKDVLGAILSKLKISLKGYC